GAKIGDAVREEPAERGVGPARDVGRREALDALRPDLDALEQRAAPVRSGLALREDRVEVKVRLDEGGRYQPAPRVHLDRAALRDRRRDARDALPSDADVDGAIAPGDTRLPDHQVHGLVSSARAT